MALIFEQIYTEGTAQLSYLIGDDRAGVGAVIDPRRDVGIYTELARQRGVRILHVIDTHIHADFVSGSWELASRTGATVRGGVRAAYERDVRTMNDGELLRLGRIWLRVLHTPGHTPEHICLLLGDDRLGEQPFGVFTGDTLLNLDVGRPDLRGEESEERDARELYRSIFSKLLPLGDRVEVYPGHGSGSSCGKSIGDRRITTIGNERIFDPILSVDQEDSFVRRLLDDMPEPPRHYARIKRLNTRGAEGPGEVPVLPPLALDEFRARSDEVTLVDTRSMLAFGGGHIEGALNIGIGPNFSNWAGRMLEADREILLVGEDAADAEEAATHLFRLGLDHVGGYLHGGMSAWQNAALPMPRLEQWTVQELDQRRTDPEVLVLDVRSDAEWADGHVPGASHIYIAHLHARIRELNPKNTIVTYCGSGYRSSTAASLLQKHGFSKVVNIPGSISAWKAAGLPMEH